MRRRFLPLIALVLATCLATASPPTASAPAGSDPYFQQDVEYARVGDASLQLNFARPLESDPPAPCIVLIHGGGWQRGHRSMHDAQIRWMAERGCEGHAQVGGGGDVAARAMLKWMVGVGAFCRNLRFRNSNKITEISKTKTE